LFWTLAFDKTITLKAGQKSDHGDATVAPERTLCINTDPVGEAVNPDYTPMLFTLEMEVKWMPLSKNMPRWETDVPDLKTPPILRRDGRYSKLLKSIGGPAT